MNLRRKTIIRLWSGLGNQLFQLAFGMAKADRLGVLVEFEVVKDDPTFEKLLSFVDLDGLKIRFMPDGMLGRLYRLGCRAAPISLRNEPFWHFSEADYCRKYGRFVGYWQSGKYFEDSEAKIRRLINLEGIDLRGVYNPSLGDARPSAAVHIRRGDFLDPRFGNRYSTVHENYYRSAMDLMRRLVPDIGFMVFSDDSRWARETYGGLPNLDIVEGNTDLQDFRLMSECRHHITANSTFSWWAAWLSQSPHHIIIMPKQWSAVPHRKIDDIYINGAIILNP